MARETLPPTDIKKLIYLMRNTFAHLRQLKRRKNLAKHIQYPKIPPILGESLVMHMIKVGKILQDLDITKVELGGKIADIIITTKSNKKLKIEVKSTGQQEFTQLYEKDIAADYLVWVDFFVVFSSKYSTIYVKVVKKPSAYLKPIKIVLTKFEELTIYEPNSLDISEL